MMKALVRKTDKRIMHINGGIYGVMLREDCWSVPIPDQDISRLYRHDDMADLDMIVEAYYPSDLEVYARDLLDLAFDPDTGAEINRQLHPSAGTDEAIGILRDQMVQWGNALGLDFTDDFTRLNDIAIAAIKDSAARKAAITNA